MNNYLEQYKILADREKSITDARLRVSSTYVLQLSSLTFAWITINYSNIFQGFKPSNNSLIRVFENHTVQNSNTLIILNIIICLAGMLISAWWFKNVKAYRKKKLHNYYGLKYIEKLFNSQNEAGKSEDPAKDKIIDFYIQEVDMKTSPFREFIEKNKKNNTLWDSIKTTDDSFAAFIFYFLFWVGGSFWFFFNCPDYGLYSLLIPLILGFLIIVFFGYY